MSNIDNKLEDSVILGILHNVWFKTPNKEFFEALKNDLLPIWPHLNESEKLACESISSSLNNEQLGDLISDYNRLFIGPTKKLAYPWSSFYTDPEGLLFGETEKQFSRFCKDLDVTFDLPYDQPLDHIGIQLAVLSKTISNDDKKASEILLSHHILPWVDVFIKSVECNSKTSYYSGFAGILRERLANLTNRYEAKPVKFKIYRSC